MASIASPYSIDRLPPQAEHYKNAFRSGTADSSRVGRFINRIVFYAVETFRDKPCYGRFNYAVGDSVRSIRFDARNRQYSAIYFDAFLPIYEPDVTASILEFAPADGVFFDVGSNWGYFSLFLASRPGFSGHIHAFEPWPASYADLTSMISQAGLQNVITAHQLALGATPGSVSMQCGRHSGLARIVDRSNGEQLEQVEQVTLDSLPIAAPDFIKLDVEGAEAAILRGGREVLATSRPTIILEHTPRATGAAAGDAPSLLADFRYDLYQPLPTLEADAPRLVRLRALSGADLDAIEQRCNLLALPRERRDSLGPYLGAG